jgi:hypothetical protein
LGISGVESGKAAALVGGPPGTELHTVLEGLPSGIVGEGLPVVVMTMGEGMVPNGVDDVIAVDDVGDIAAVVAPGMAGETALLTVDDVGTGIALMEGGGRAGTGGCGGGVATPGNDVAGCAGSVSVAVLPVAGVEEVAGTVGVVGDADSGVPPVPTADGRELTGTAGVPGVICPVGVEQVTTVPGIVGSEASGTGASVVSRAPGWVVAENGLGPLSGDVTIVPGVDARPIAVVPIVETCARQALPPSSSVAVVNSKRRIVTPPWPRSGSSAACEPRPCDRRRGRPSG